MLAFANALFPDIQMTLLFFGLAAFPPALLQSFLASLLQGLQDFSRFNAALMVGPIFTLAFVIATVLFLDFGVPGALSSFIAGQIVSLFVTYALVRRSPQPIIPLELSGSAFSKKAISYGWKAHLSNILAFVNYKADIFLVNFFLNPAATGIYVIAVQLAERLWILSQAISTVLLPRLAQDLKTSSSNTNLTPVAARWSFLY